MANVYVSFLGTNDYLPCIYCKDDKEFRDTRFVQEATLGICCREWTDEDRIIIFTTDEAYQANWLDDGHTDRKTGKPLKRKGLRRCIEDLELRPSVLQADIPLGQSEEEIWEIFNCIFGHLNQGDEVVFDITHAFRSIPMLAIVVLNYAKVIKNLTVRGIYYGAFEVLGNFFEVRNMPPEERRAPIFELTAFDRLMDWSLAIDRFLGAGDAVMACQVAAGSLKPVLRATKGQDKAATAMRDVAKYLESFSKTLSTCRGLDISKVTRLLKEQIDKCEEHPALRPFHPLLDRVREQLSPFTGDTVSDGIHAAKWCRDHNLIQQGFTILQEFLVSHFITEIGEDPGDLKNENREIAGQSVKIHLENMPRDKWIKPASAYPEITNRFLEFHKTRHELAKIFRQLSDYRNDLNHSGIRPGPMAAEKFEKKLTELLSRVENEMRIS